MNHQEAVSSHATERYLLEEMTEVEKFAFEDHYFDCAECADDVRAAALMREGVKEGMLGAVAPAPVSTAEPADEQKRGIIHAMPQRSSTVPAQRTSWLSARRYPRQVCGMLL